jgi:hypothetical protein
MAKKLSLMLAAVAVLAFAVPSIASASEATLPAGTRAPVGTKIVGTGTDVILQSSLLGKITCSTLNLNGEITKNDGTTVEGSGANVSPTQSGCVNGEKAVNVTEVEVTKLFSTTTENEKHEKVLTSTASFVAHVDVGPELKCVFTGTNVPFTFTSGTDTITFTSAAGVVGVPAACGTAKLTASFTLESTTGVALILDA